MEYENAKSAVIALLDEAHNARTTATNLRAVLSHATVQLMLWQEARLDDNARRAELFRMVDAGTLALSIGGGRCIAEVMPNTMMSQPTKQAKRSDGSCENCDT